MIAFLLVMSVRLKQHIRSRTQLGNVPTISATVELWGWSSRLSDWTIHTDQRDHQVKYVEITVQ